MASDDTAYEALLLLRAFWFPASLLILFVAVGVVVVVESGQLDDCEAHAKAWSAAHLYERVTITCAPVHRNRRRCTVRPHGERPIALTCRPGDVALALRGDE